MSENNSVVAVYNSHDQAEKAVEELRRAGIDVKNHSEEQVTGYYNTGDRMKSWGQFGAFWGAFWGLLFGAALFVIPGV
jgi:hypothetical protein